MPTITILNAKPSSQALRGQNVKITVNLTTESAEFAQLQVGQFCEYGDLKGRIYSIDTFGNSFEIIPAQPNFSFGGEGYLLDDSNIDVTI